MQVAIKKVLQDKRFKNRELQIMKMMGHPNVVDLKHCFYTNTDKDEVRRRSPLRRAPLLLGDLQAYHLRPLNTRCNEVTCLQHSHRQTGT